MVVLRLLMIVIGSIITGLGIGLATSTGYGVDSISVFWSGVASNLGITFGQALILVSAIIVLIVWPLDRKQLSIGTILNPIVVGVSSDIFIANIKGFESTTLNIIVLLLGIVLVGVGLGIYAYANLGRGPYEAIVLAIVDKFKTKFIYVRYAFDIGFLVLGIVLGEKLTLGPIISALILGYIIQGTMSGLDRINKLNNIVKST